jgi:hypothetical protein
MYHLAAELRNGGTRRENRRELQGFSPSLNLENRIL